MPRSDGSFMQPARVVPALGDGRDRPWARGLEGQHVAYHELRFAGHPDVADERLRHREIQHAVEGTAQVADPETRAHAGIPLAPALPCAAIDDRIVVEHQEAD